MQKNQYHLLLVILYGTALAWSAIRPKEYFTWFLEVAPSLIAFVILALSYKRFPLTNLAYTLIVIHSCILFVGGHYTYAEVPLFNWIRDTFHQSRNNYDKVGHFAQGFVPAIIAREIFIRKNIIPSRQWMNFLIVAVCLAISAMYEFLEWFVAEASGESADAFLATQGYVWDTQSDMLFASIGAIVALLLLSRYHDKQVLLLEN